MPFYIETNHGVSHTWGQEDEKPKLKGQITLLKVDGPELTKLSLTFSNIPVKQPSTIYRSWLADFIYDNL